MTLIEEEKLDAGAECIHVSVNRAVLSSRYSMVRVHRDTLVKLQKLKPRYRAKSMNQLITRLIDKAAEKEGKRCRNK